MSEVLEYQLTEATREIRELLNELQISFKDRDDLLFVQGVLSMNELLLIDSIVTKYECKFKLIASKRYIVIHISNYKLKS